MKYNMWKEIERDAQMIQVENGIQPGNRCLEVNTDADDVIIKNKQNKMNNAKIQWKKIGFCWIASESEMQNKEKDSLKKLSKVKWQQQNSNNNKFDWIAPCWKATTTTW